MALPPGIAMGNVSSNAASPPLSVDTIVDPMKLSPSPYPKMSQFGLEKNSKVKLVSAVLFRVPPIVVVLPSETAEVRTGKFWPLFTPVSASPGSFAVTEPGSKSMPRATLEWIELPDTLLPVPSQRTATPTELKAMTLPALGAVPPTVVLAAPSRVTP
jgi:hypothetical protein